MSSVQSVFRESAVEAIRHGAIVVLVGIPASWIFADVVEPSSVFWSTVVAVLGTFAVRFLVSAVEAGEPY